MNKIILGRGKGKTTQLIELSGNTSSYIVCINQRECHRIVSIAREMKIDIPFPLTYDEFINKKYYGKGIKGFLIDNAELLLEYMSSVKIDAITLSP